MNPTVLIAALIVVVILCKRHQGNWLWFGLALMWLWMTPLTTRGLGLSLEREWLVDGKVPKVGSFPNVDAIVLLGGGMDVMTNMSDYAEMRMSADRVWQAARLYKAGKAPRIFVTGKGNEFTTKGLLVDLGVSTNAMVFVDQARNTEEEAKAVSVLCSTSTLNSASTRPKILVVTSAWHMKRAMLMFTKYAPSLNAIPAPTDFEAMTYFADGFGLDEFLPDGQAIFANEIYFHEWLGYWGYKLFR